MEIVEGRMAVGESVSGTLVDETFSARTKESIKNIAFGSIAGMVGKMFEYPFDTVKVRLQSQPDYLPLLYKGPLDCLKKSLRRDGIIGIYRGLSAPLVGAAVENSSLFFSYRIAQDVLRAVAYAEDDTLPLSALFCCGAVSGATTSLFLTPIELVKCKLQVPIESQSIGAPKLGIAQTIASVYRHQGVLGFWRGQIGTLIRETGGSAAWFGSWEGTSHLFRRMKNEGTNVPLPLHQQLIAGASAGVSYNFLFYPADTIKSRMQTENVAEMRGTGARSFWTIANALWKQQGIKGMYRGCGITVARSAPSSALIFTIYDLMMRNLWVDK